MFDRFYQRSYYSHVNNRKFKTAIQLRKCKCKNNEISKNLSKLVAEKCLNIVN